MALYRHDLAICPWCDGESGHRVDHLYSDPMPCKAGPWYCKACRKSFRVTVNRPGDVTMERADNKDAISRSMALLKFSGQDGPVFFVFDHDRHHTDGSSPETDEENQKHQRYFFEEHSCPTNWLRDCVAVIDGGDCDQHGFLEFVRAVDVPLEFDADDDGQWPILFPEAFPGETIDGHATEIKGLLTKRD